MDNGCNITVNNCDLYYGDFHALKNICIEILEHEVTALIGPSGCGKSTFIRIINRMNDLIEDCRITGEILIGGQDIYAKGTDVTLLRKNAGMVFQKPNPFPMSIFDNIAIGPRHHGVKRRYELEEIVERSLSQVALWDEVKDSLKGSGFDLSPGQQQRLCIARTLAMEPEVILMDESCSALDPESTMKIEELMLELVKKYTIIIVTHNMEQALRISDMAAFMMIEQDKVGTLVEYAPTTQIFSNPKDKRTEDYITGRFG